jgi:hypothetical protein
MCGARLSRTFAHMHPIVMSVIAADKTAEMIANHPSRAPRAGRLRRLRIARRASRITHAE